MENVQVYHPVPTAHTVCFFLLLVSPLNRLDFRKGLGLRVADCVFVSLAQAIAPTFRLFFFFFLGGGGGEEGEYYERLIEQQLQCILAKLMCRSFINESCKDTKACASWYTVLTLR